MERKIKILNGTLDVALRILAVLTTCKCKMSEDRLAIYSYFAMHISDMNNKEKSLHPDIPYRFSGYTKSREVIPSAINLLIEKGLLDCDFTDKEIMYKSSDMGDALYNQIDGRYKEILVSTILKVNTVLRNKTDNQLNNIVNCGLPNWGSEFINESILNQIVNE